MIMSRGFQVAKGFENAEIILPERKTRLSAGYDIGAAEDCTIPPFKWGDKPTLVKTGLKAFMENDEYLVLFEPYIKLIKSKEPRDTIHDLLERKDVLQSSIMFREYSSSINNEKQGSHKNIAI